MFFKLRTCLCWGGGWRTTGWGWKRGYPPPPPCQWRRIPKGTRSPASFLNSCCFFYTPTSILGATLIWNKTNKLANTTAKTFVSVCQDFNTEVEPKLRSFEVSWLLFMRNVLPPLTILSVHCIYVSKMRVEVCIQTKRANTQITLC